MKICIIGNGLTALILAKNLLKRKISVHLFEDNKIYNPSKIRTIGVTQKNFELINNDLPEIKNISHPIKKIIVFNHSNTEKILNFEEKNKFEMWMFRYSKIYNLFKKKLNKEKNLYYVKKNLQKIQLNTNFLKSYDLIIDTHLNNSFSRKNFSKKLKKNYFSKAYVTILEHEKISNDVARQIFTDNGPLAFLPLSNTETSIVYSIKIRKNIKYQDSEIEQLIKKNNTKYIIKSFKNFEKFDLKLSLFRKYFFKNVLAFGDNLHRIHPLAGQGFNMNLRDINILCKIIDNKLRTGLPLDKSVLSEFEKTTKYKNTIFASGIDVLHEFFQLEKKLPLKVSKKIFDIFNSNKLLSKYTKKIANEGLNF